MRYSWVPGWYVRLWLMKHRQWKHDTDQRRKAIAASWERNCGKAQRAERALYYALGWLTMILATLGAAALYAAAVMLR